jgi:hypothetical protein
MVIASSRYSVAPERSGNVELVRDPVPRTETGNRMYCPRCETTLSVSYEESLCMVCGYADYDYVSPNAKNGHQSMISSGTRYVLRYVGDFPSLSDTLTHVKLKRLRNRVVYGVTCPFCSGAMEQSSLSGKRREMREERYRCTDGHRVSLTPTPSGALGWK